MLPVAKFSASLILLCIAGGKQPNQSQPSPGSRGWQREVGSTGLRLRPVWGSAPASREATPLTGDSLLTPPKRIVGPPSAGGLTRTGGLPGSPETPSQIAATADVLQLYSRPQQDIRTPGSGDKRQKPSVSDSPGISQTREGNMGASPEAAACEEMPAAAAASPVSSEPPGSFVPDTYPGIGADTDPCAQPAGSHATSKACAEVSKHGEDGLEDDGVADVPPPKRRRLSLEGGKVPKGGNEAQARTPQNGRKDPVRKGLHAMGGAHPRNGRGAVAMPVTRALANELGRDASPRMTRCFGKIPSDIHIRIV